MNLVLSSTVLYFLATLFLTNSMFIWAEGTAPIILLTLSVVALIISYLVVVLKLKHVGKLFLPIVIVAFACKLIMVFTPVLLTGDLYRYVFEGYLLRDGINPYLHAPEHFAKVPNLPDVWEHVEYKHLSAIYPPVALIFFTIFAHSIFSWKLFLFFIEIINFLLLSEILKKLNIHKSAALTYVLSPLALVEISLSGHLEGLMITFILAFYYFFHQRKRIRASIFASLAFCVKYIPGLFVLVNLIKLLKDKKPKEFLRYVLLIFFFVCLIIIPFFHHGYFSSLIAYLQHWRFNDSVFHLVGFLFQVDWEDSMALSSIKLPLILLWIALFLILNLKSKNIFLITAWSYAIYLLLSPTAHPWYFLWVLPFLCFYPDKSLIVLCTTVLFSYEARLFNLDQPSLEIKLIEYLPFVAIACVNFFYWKKRN